MSAKNLSPEPVYMAYDPGASGGLATCWLGESITTQPVRNLQVPEEVHVSIDIGRRIYLAVEQKKGRNSRFAVTTALGNMFADELKKLHPRMVKVVFIDPDTWQAGLGVCNPDTDRPGRVPYDAYSIQHLGGLASHSQDEHAARCILHWAIKTGAWQ